MSRIGIQPITIEEGVEVNVAGSKVDVKGPKGELHYELPENIVAEVKEGQLTVTRTKEDKQTMSLHGTFRSILDSAVTGVKDGFEKKLEIHGVGYRAKPEGTGVSLTLGWNHPVVFTPPEGVELEVPDETTVIVRGFDKQKVGEFAAKIREVRKPEPYKGKGIRYEGEYVRSKTPKVVGVE